ncbi:MAG: response regulator [Deltaproteobacteria bacterium]|nr:response regulator [Deltaproteobacteria bacterium]
MAGVLIVEDDRLAGNAIARLVRKTPRHDGIGRGVLVARNAATARDILRRSDIVLLAAIFDVKLPDGDGLAVIAEFAERLEGVPVLVLTGHHDEAALSQRAFLLGASFVAKPVDPAIVRRFILGATTRRLVAERQVRGVVESWIRRYRLTPRQAQLLGSAVAGETPDAFRAATGISPDRYKELVGELLARCHRRHLDDVALAVHREALGTPRKTSDRPALAAVGARTTHP